jgi:hypothetical protein
MSIRFFVGREAGSDDSGEHVMLFDSVTGRALPLPYFRGEPTLEVDAFDEAEDFVDYARDVRGISHLQVLTGITGLWLFNDWWQLRAERLRELVERRNAQPLHDEVSFIVRRIEVP